MFLSVPLHHCCQFGTGEPWNNRDQPVGWYPVYQQTFLTINDGTTILSHGMYTIGQTLC